MQHACAVARAAHAGIGDPHHVADALFEQRLRDRQHAPLRHAGGAEGAGIAEHEHVVGRAAQRRVVDPRLEIRIRVEDDRAAGVLEQPRLSGCRLDHAAVRRDVAAEHEGATSLRERPIHWQDDAVVDHLGAGDVFPECAAGHRQAARVEQGRQPRKQRGHAAGVVKVFHQKLARRTEVADHGRRAGERVESVERKRHARPSGEGEQVDDRVGRPSQCHVGDDRVVERRGGEDPRWPQVLPDHVDDPTAAGSRHPGMRGMDRRNRRGTGKHHAHRLGDRGERGGRSHRHAGARRPRDALFELPPHAAVEAPGLPLRPEFPDIGAAAEPLIPPAAGQHRPRRHEDRRQVRRDGPHQEAGHGLVAPAHQHRAIDGMALQHLLDLERQEVAIEHRRRLHEHFRQGEHRDFHRKSARLPDATFHFLNTLGEVGVALAQIAPRIEDRDDRPALRLFGRVAHLPQAATMAEAPQIVGGEPALRPQFTGLESSLVLRVWHAAPACPWLDLRVFVAERWRALYALVRHSQRVLSKAMSS